MVAGSRVPALSLDLFIPCSSKGPWGALHMRSDHLAPKTGVRFYREHLYPRHAGSALKTRVCLNRGFWYLAVLPSIRVTLPTRVHMNEADSRSLWRLENFVQAPRLL